MIDSLRVCRAATDRIGVMRVNIHASSQGGDSVSSQRCTSIPEEEGAPHAPYQTVS